jgi:hypothetical protein
LKRIGSKHNRQREQAIHPIGEQQTNIMDSGITTTFNRKKSDPNRKVKIFFLNKNSIEFLIIFFYSVPQRYQI